MISIVRARIGAASLLAAILALSEPASAAQLCPLVSPPAGTTTVTTSPNSYYPGAGTATAGSTTVPIGTLNGTTAIAAGDEILVMQMQDSSINPTNSAAYGANNGTGRGVTSDNTSGLYEYAIVTATGAGTLTIRGNGAGNGLVNTYHTAAATLTKGGQTYQVVRVPRYNNVTLNIAGSAVIPWNGSSGGIFAIDASGTITVTGTVNADGAGFRGGGRLSQTGSAIAPILGVNFDYAVGGAVGYDGEKGGGTVGTPQLVYNGSAIITAPSDTMPGGSAARGAPGIAGGGGTDADPQANDYNSGGGGGANGGDGGLGGNNWSPNEQSTAAEDSGAVDPAHNVYQVGGLGGVAFAPAASGRVVFGGGGGAGSINNNTNAPFGASGGSGGGMILIRAGTVSGGTLSSNGARGVDADNDGGGAGGAGGSIVVTATNSIAGTTARANGGNGANTRVGTATTTEKHGPGGGGGGGVIITSSAIATSVSGGLNGTTLSTAVPYGAKPGSPGRTFTAAPTAIPGVSSAAECLVNALTITKTGTTAASPGGLVFYSIVVSNAGPGRADGTTVSDPVPSGITIKGTPTCSGAGGAVCGATTVAGQTLSGTITTLPVGGTVTYSIDAQAPTSPSNPYVNTATVAPPPTNSDPNSNISTVSTTVTQSNGLSKTVRNITKGETTGVGANLGIPGDTLEYVLSFTNTTGSPLTTFAISDPMPVQTTFVSATCGPLPTGVTTCTIANPAVGATGTVTYAYGQPFPTGATATFVLQVKIK